jgi:hypothetical protein
MHPNCRPFNKQFLNEKDANFAFGRLAYFEIGRIDGRFQSLRIEWLFTVLVTDGNRWFKSF